MMTMKPQLHYVSKGSSLMIGAVENPKSYRGSSSKQELERRGFYLVIVWHYLLP